MSVILSVYINGKNILQYDKNTRLPGKQRQFLDAMDRDMDEGFEINDEIIESADKMQRANYVAMNLLYAIETKNESMTSATCGYLANRLPELKQIRSVDSGEEITMHLIFNDEK